MHSDPTAPQALAGIRIVDASRLLPGALCTQMLADLGADVIKVEAPGRGDYQRDFAPINRQDSGTFLLCNRNKRSLTLNLKSQAGKQVFMAMADRADVVLEGFRPGVMQRLGLDYEALSARNPRLIYCAISGFGQDGPYKHLPGHDLNYMGLQGALQMFGRGGRPAVPGTLVADIGGGSLMGVFGILAAIVARQTTGRGQMVDVSMFDGAQSFLAYHAAEPLFAGREPHGGEYLNLGGAPCYNVYRCQDGNYLALAAFEEHFWMRFCEVTGLVQWKDQQWPEGQARDAQQQSLAALFTSRTRDEWCRFLAGHDLPVTPVNTMGEALADPHVTARGLIQHMDHPVEGTIPQLGFPVKFSDTPGQLRRPPPTLGEHSNEILAELGYDAAAIDHMRASGVV
ncbi:CaiB/BaiF CoA-transferase family protein [Bordetella sp. BOR01]|uniref:CaiB/BaiF CoA transferase family protein n=1 Tax=Bordetella sp. BOR01 TaxID=2854779 RepID=UPI001C47896F|nr:CaiB/BaiF CoA-transferase family protein [Bordetella sp. BOR01]MBV7483218.1 CoA transferase [Bordetella sp. BOR01]